MATITRRIGVAILTLALVVVACGDDAASDTTTTAATTGTTAGTATTAAGAGPSIDTTEYRAFRAQPAVCDAAAPPEAEEMLFGAPDDLGLVGPVTVILHMSCGTVTLELDPSIAPATVNSFVFLAENGYFDGTVSHRVYPGFMIQAGDPTATGRGGPGYVIPDELPDQGFVYTRGVVAMANAGPETGGSQFFMMLADVALPPAYSVFGRIVDGIEVLDRIAEVPLTARRAGAEVSSPLESVYIERVEVRR